MNKLFTKIVGAALGLTMAIGVGVAVASNREAIPAYADGTAINYNKIENNAKYFITATYNSTEYMLEAGRSFVAGSSGIAAFNKSTATESQAWTFSGTTNGTSWTISTVVNDTTYYLDVTNNNNGVRCNQTTSVTWTSSRGGSDAYTYLTSSDGSNTRYLALYQSTNWRCYKNTSSGVPALKLYKFESGSSQTVTAVATPVAGNTFVKTYSNVDSTTAWSTTGLSASVTVSPSGTYTGSITYNFTPSTPLDYVKGGNTSLSITATAGEITSSALVINDMSVTAKDGMTEDNPISPSEAKAMVGTATSGFDCYYVAGTVVSANDPSSGSQTYFISDDGTATDQIEIYKGKYLDNADFDSNNALKAGDEVTVYGDLTYYSSGSIVEFKQGSVVVAYRDPSATATTTYYTLSAPASQSIAVGDTYTPTVKAIKDSDSSETTLSAGSYTLSSSNTSVATVDSGTGVITAVAKGSATITVSKDKVIDLVNDNTDEYASTSIAITVTGAQHSGTFASFATDIVEGYYVICDGTAGLGNTISSSRFTNATVTFTNEKIVTPDMSLVWHITQSGDYWLIQNMETNTYAGSTSSKNTGAMLSDSTSSYAKWTISYSSGFTFINYGRTQSGSDTGNAYLKHNGNNGWAAYASGTGTAPQLYKLEETVAAVTLSSNKAYLTSIGDTGSLTATAYSDNAKTKQITGLVATDFTFTSSNPSVVSVAANGTITAVATGSVTITASKDNVTSDSITVKVVTVSIDLINDGSVLEELEEGTFTYSWSSNELKPSSPVATWSSSNSSNIEVNASTGAYTAGFDGTSATITVSVVAEGYTFTASREFSVVSSIVAAHSIDVEEGNSVVAYMGSNKNLTITVLGSDGTTPATNQNVTCVSSKTSVLTVTNAGVITPVSRGTATVTITDEGNLCDPVVVNVRVRNAVLGDAQQMGVLDLSGYKSSTPSSDVSGDYTTKNSYAAPTDVELSGYYYNGSTEDAARFGKSGGSGTITLTFANALVKRVDIKAKLWSGDSGLLTVADASTSDTFSDSEYVTATYTFSSLTNSVEITAAGKPRFYISEVTVYSAQSDISSSSDAQAVYTFEESYMKMEQYIGNETYDETRCTTNYTAAKTAFNGLSPAQRSLFLSNSAFADSAERLLAWATANGDSLNVNNELAQASRVPFIGFSSETSNTAAIIIIVSLVGLTAIGGYFFIGKRKEQ